MSANSTSLPLHTNIAGARAKRPLDKDKLAMVPRPEAARVAHAALFGVQDESPERMMLGIAVLFAATCHRCKVDPHDLHTMALRVLTAPEAGDKQTDAALQVLRDFMGLRVMGQEVTVS